MKIFSTGSRAKTGYLSGITHETDVPSGIVILMVLPLAMVPENYASSLALSAFILRQ